MMNHTHFGGGGGDTELSLQDVSFDAEENIHDQLPSPEEVKVHVAPTKNFRRTGLVLFACMLLVGATLAVIGVVVTKNKEARNAERMAERLDHVVDFLSNYSDPDALANHESPQYRAAKWMVYEDVLQRKLPTNGGGDDEWKFLQRYTLVVLKYATQADGPWTYPQLHFVAPKRHECNWNHPFQSLSDESTATFTMGVICNDEKQVQKLIIDGNGLSGVLPQELSLLQHLTKLSLDGNDLVGTIPSSFASLTKLHSLTLTYNSLEGPLPSWLGALTKLTVLGLANNRFHGHLPSDLAALSALKTFALDDNHLIGNLSVISHLKKLQELYLESNIFTGSIEPAVHLEKLQVLDVSSNRLHDEIPRALFRLPDLRIVDLHDNMLHGSLSTDMPHSNTISFLALHDNILTGSIPATMNHLSALKHLDLSSNHFDGNIPATLGDLTNLEYLVLSNNPHLTGGSLPNMKNLTNLVELSLQHTNRTGNLPHWLGDLEKLVVLDLGENHFDGKIPQHIGNLDSLELLFLHRNKLTGTLPPQMSHLSNLALFAMDKNSLVGDTNPVCGIESLQVLVADCGGDSPEVDCPCCSECCKDDDADCNKDLLLISYNPTWEDRYQRHDYIVNGLTLAPSNHKP